VGIVRRNSTLLPAQKCPLLLLLHHMVCPPCLLLLLLLRGWLVDTLDGQPGAWLLKQRQKTEFAHTRQGYLNSNVTAW
jgi:hypothetical protein